MIFAKSFSLNICAFVAKLVTRRVYAGIEVGLAKPKFKDRGIACVSDMLFKVMLMLLLQRDNLLLY